MRGSTSARRGAVAAMVAVAVLGPAAPAAAHVTIDPSTTAAGSLAVLTVTVPHGCAGSPTTAVTVSVPPEVVEVGVAPAAGAPATAWATEVRTEPLAEPATAHDGTTLTERVALVTFRAATPLPDGEQGVVALEVRLPDAEGATLAFPTVQTCEQGEVAWIEVAAAGAGDGLARPAPTLVVTARDPAAPPPVAPTATAAPGTEDVAQPASGDGGVVEALDAAGSGAVADGDVDGGAAPVAAAVGVTALLGGLVGGGLLVRRRRRS